MDFNFVTDNSIRGKMRRFLADNSPKERKRERERQGYFKSAFYGKKIYFRIEEIKINNIFTSKYLVFFTQGKIIKPPFLNKEQRKRFDMILKTVGKGYIQEVSKEGKKYKEIGELGRCAKVPKGLEKAIKQGIVVELK